jgi:sodium transport system permease protein
MSREHILQVFRKDGLEILRDRRTLFVNIVLPLLLYPLMLLFGLQVYQLTLLQKEEQPLLLLAGVPAELASALAQAPAPGTAAPAPAPVPEIEVGPRQARPPRDGMATRPATAQESAALLPAAVHEWEEDDQPAAPSAPAGAPAGPSLDAQALAVLRDHHAVAALVRLEDRDGRQRLALVLDDANRRADAVATAVQDAVHAYSERLVERRLDQAHLPRTTAHPLRAEILDVAPRAQAIRTRLSGTLPLLLVVLAASGAFFPALDLLSGERERGTLESLLSLPVRRRDIFLGKLLVACAAAAASVLLNLLSVGITVVVATHHLAGAHGSAVSGLFSVSLGALALCAVVLLPLTVTLAATALAVTGLASTSKEAQNYLTPFFLVVFVLSMVCLIPGTKPSVILDLVPVVGPVLALKESLQAEALPWLHLALTGAASLALGWVVVGWSTRLLEDERFRYPTLVRAGWGRFRRWGRGPAVPGGLEAMALYAVAIGVFIMLSALLETAPLLTRLSVPLLAFAVLAGVHTWLGAYSPAACLALRRPSARSVGAALGLVPCAVIISCALGMLQEYVQQRFGGGGPGEGAEKIEELINGLLAGYGMTVTVMLVGVLPGICEEIFFRGSMVAGLQRGIGPIGAICVSAFLFAASHGSPDRFLPQCVLGVLLAVLVLRSGSILPGMLVHALHNAVIVVLSLDGLAIARALHLQAHLPALEFAALLCAPLAVALTIVLLAVAGPGPRPAAAAAGLRTATAS